MTIISGIENIQKGTSVKLDLNKTELESHVNVVADPYYSNSARWRFVQLIYKAAVTNQTIEVYFNYEDVLPAGDFITSPFVTTNFEIEALNIYDFDGGIFSIYREDLVTAEFDVSLIDSFGVQSYLFTTAAESVYTGATPITGHHTQSMWFKANDPSLGVESRLLSIGDQAGILLYKDASENLNIYVNTATPIDRPVLPSVDIYDGNWHSIVLAYSALFNEVTVFIDGVQEQVVTGISLATNNNTYIGNVGASLTATPNIVGIDGWVAQAETWSTYFTPAMALEYHNGGSVINPQIHSEYSSIINNWTFGDDSGDDGSVVVDLEGNGNLTTYDALGSTVTLSIEEEHPGL